MMQISIIDYGCGNVKSVYNAFNAIRRNKKFKILVTSNKKEITNSSHIVLPGVGAFESCITGLKKSDLLEIITKKVQENFTPFLGICVGMQMLATRGYEHGTFQGLGWIEGEVKKIIKKKDLKIPHMGWNNVSIKKETPFVKKLKTKVNLNKATAYFVHSYNFSNFNKDELIMTTNYEQQITAMVGRDNIIGTQFHPEKSHFFGLAFLETFLEYENL